MTSFQDLIQRANTDAQFRSRLKANPGAACKDAGIELPAGKTIKVIDPQPSEIYLVLQPLADGELEDASLEAVAGGRSLLDAALTNIGSALTQVYGTIDPNDTKDLKDIK